LPRTVQCLFESRNIHVRCKEKHLAKEATVVIGDKNTLQRLTYLFARSFVRSFVRSCMHVYTKSSTKAIGKFERKKKKKNFFL